MWTAIKTLASSRAVPWGLTVLCVISVLVYLRFVPPSPPTYDPAPQAAGKAKEPKVVTKHVTKYVKVPGPERIVYLDKPEAAEVLNMPELNQTPDNVLAVAKIQCPEQDVTAVSLIDSQGQGSIIYRMEPQKFLHIKKEFGVRAGAGSGGLMAAEVYARPLRIGPVNVEVRGWISRTDAHGGDGGGAVLIDYRF